MIHRALEQGIFLQYTHDFASVSGLDAGFLPTLSNDLDVWIPWLSFRSKPRHAVRVLFPFPGVAFFEVEGFGSLGGEVRDESERLGREGKEMVCHGADW